MNDAVTFQVEFWYGTCPVTRRIVQLLTTEREEAIQNYSYLKATMGSTRMARRAGT